MEYEGKLRDGTKVLFRRIRPDDKERLELIAEAREDGRAYVGARLRSAADGFEREDHAAP
jgi:hypothetical protein